MEKSYVWNYNSEGDGSTPLSQDDFDTMFKILSSLHGGQGISLTNKYDYTQLTNTFSVGNGYSMVDGKLHFLDGTVNISVPFVSDVGKSQYICVGLYANYNNNTVRVVSIAGTASTSPSVPSYDQISGASYFLPLYKLLVTNNSYIVTDLRTSIYSDVNWTMFGDGTFPETLIPDGSIHSSKIADFTINGGLITDATIPVDKFADFSSANYVTSVGHVGGSETDMSTSGSSFYPHETSGSVVTYTEVRELCGRFSVSVPQTNTLNDGLTLVVNYPSELPNKALVFAVPDDGRVRCTVTANTVTSFTLYFYHPFSPTITTCVNWKVVYIGD